MREAIEKSLLTPRHSHTAPAELQPPRSRDPSSLPPLAIYPHPASAKRGFRASIVWACLCLCLACLSSIFMPCTPPSPLYSSTICCRRSAPVLYHTPEHSNSTRPGHIPPASSISRIAPPSRIHPVAPARLSATAHRVANNHRHERPQPSAHRILRTPDISGPSRPLLGRYGRPCNGPRAHLHSNAHAAWDA